MKLAAAFAPWIFVPYEAERVPALTELNGTNSDYVVVAKLGFGWFDPDEAKPDALVLAHNLLRNPARPRRHAYALPRGVKDLKLWKDRCADNRRPDRVRCAGIRLHRDRARKILALRKNGVCERTARTGRHSGILKGAGYVDALSAARYAVSPPGVGFANYRTAPRPFHARRRVGRRRRAFSRRRHRGDRRRRRADSGTTDVAAPAGSRRGPPRRTAPRPRKERHGVGFPAE